MKALFSMLLPGICFLTLSCKSSKEDLRKAFYDKCSNEAMKTVSGDNETQKALVTQYCNCVSDKVLEKFSAEEIEAFSKDNSDVAAQKWLQVVEPCIDEMREGMRNEYDSSN